MNKEQRQTAQHLCNELEALRLMCRSLMSEFEYREERHSEEWTEQIAAIDKTLGALTRAQRKAPLIAFEPEIRIIG
jgi:hypothetical protein